ncbi:uncharacterized protein BDW43DRAFT_292614 [Aspergillus alliaceus]|uniref:uncharacterized protein n=1 Tax=Petromyces alliaceus TaxID=209559 RepID=UPI0012A6A8FE|nr:uncharacterized protein BDW43DRAFT_292614 [Aspergillus alliaceus]KAB8227939.1 hypothetical protein BDW43DRAFT_292614 [Aspergillus alliaceus]
MSPEQINLIENLFSWPTSPSLEEEWKRQNAATRAVSQYCPIPEGGPLRRRPKRSVPSNGFGSELQANYKCSANKNC